MSKKPTVEDTVKIDENEVKKEEKEKKIVIINDTDYTTQDKNDPKYSLSQKYAIEISTPLSQEYAEITSLSLSQKYTQLHTTALSQRYIEKTITLSQKYIQS